MTDQFDNQIKAIATVRFVARTLCGLSPARFYQLIKVGVFPPPVYDASTRRPFYTEDQQRECIEVRRRNCGINGKPVMFYARRIGGAEPIARSRPRKPASSRQQAEHSDLIDSLRGLGLTNITVKGVAMAVKQLFPRGVAMVPESELIRAVFLHLKRQDQADNVG